MMRTPHFLRLAEIDERRFINACRHGLVHLTWERVTVRLSRDEFRRLAELLARSADALPPSSLRDGSLEVSRSAHGDCVLRLGSLALSLSQEEHHALSRAATEAVEQLDKILDTGMWDEDRADGGESAPRSILEHFRQHRFSEN